MHKRKILPILLVASLCAMLLGGCARVERSEQSDVSRFKIIEETTIWRVVYDKETKVMYVTSVGSYNSGNFTLLVDTDGKPLLWKGEQE